MAQNFYLNSSTIGVDLNNASATALFAVGTHVLGTQGTEFVYVQAGTSIVGQRFVAFQSGTYTAGHASGADLVTNGYVIANAQTSISAQAYGWVCIRGHYLTVASSGSCTTGPAIGLFLAAGGSTGFISTSVSGSGTMAGISIVDATQSTSAAGGTVIVNMTWPRTYTQVG